MKSYIVRIELVESSPLIWRRIVLPAGATFKRLHDIIQNITNFRSGYPSDDYHLYKFDLVESNMIITNDEEAYLEYKLYTKNKKQHNNALITDHRSQCNNEDSIPKKTNTHVYKPSAKKIDDYLERFGEIRYNYDFGDNWWFSITLEEIVYDYYFGYPTLLDGAETAPPEDVGGIEAFYDFLKIYEDFCHPEHLRIRNWANSQLFRNYDPNFINDLLKYLNYKKTEWEKINHINYKVINDKYRK